MSLYKRGTKWCMNFTYLGVRVNRSTGESSRAKALLCVEREKAKINQLSLLPAREVVMLSDAIERVYESHFDQQTNASQRYSQLQTCLEIIGDKPLHKLTANTFSFLKSELSKGRKTATVNHFLTAIRKVMTVAWQEWEVIDRVPYIEIKAVKSSREQTISPEMLEDITSEMDEDIAGLVELLYETGLRLSEALCLTFEGNVDLDKGVITLKASETKGKQPRVVPLSTKAKAVFTDQEWVHSDGRIFPYSRQYVSRCFKQARDNLGFHPELCIHSLRHSCATNLVSAGKDIYMVAKMLGHSTVTMTERYVHLRPDYLMDLVE